MIKKQLGGDRIGSGNKLSVEMHGYARSTHNVSTIKRTTMTVGTLVPIWSKLALPGDTWELDIDALVNTNPTEGPLFGSMKFEVHVYRWDWRLGIAKLHMNLLGEGNDISNIKLPLVRMEAPKIDWSRRPDNQQINPSSIWQYLGVAGLGDVVDPLEEIVTRDINALSYIAYWDIYKNYYANKQEGIGVVIHNSDVTKTVTQVFINDGTTYTEMFSYTSGQPGVAWTMAPDTVINFTYVGDKPLPRELELNGSISVGTGGGIRMSDIFNKFEYKVSGSDLYLECSEPKMQYSGGYTLWWQYGEPERNMMPKLETFDLKNIDEMKMDILADVKNTGNFIIDKDSIAPYGLSLKKEGEVWSKWISQEGLGIKTYNSDINNNWIDTDWINSVNNRTKVSTDGSGQFTIDSLLINQKKFNYLNRIAMAGGTVDDWRQVTYDAKRLSKTEIPVFEGGLSKEIIFDEVVSTVGTNVIDEARGETMVGQPLGTLAARGKFGSKHEGGKISINVDEECQLIAIACITPRVDYSQGNDFEIDLKTLEDLHKPEFDQIGFEDRLVDRMAWWSTKIPINRVPVFKSVGKQPAWINYQTDVDKVYGLFAEEDSEMWMTLNRKYDWDSDDKDVKDLTTYIDPSKFNDIFAYKALDAQNFKVQIGVKAIARRKMSANPIPNA